VSAIRLLISTLSMILWLLW